MKNGVIGQPLRNMAQPTMEIDATVCAVLIHHFRKVQMPPALQISQLLAPLADTLVKEITRHFSAD